MSASIALKQLLARRILARRRLLQFTLLTYPTYLAGWVHEDICRRLEKFSADIAAGKSPRLMLLMPPRHGKACEVGTLVPTPNGFRRIETLSVGDLVFGRDGRPTKVLAVSEIWKDRQLFEVTSDDGARVVVDAEHEWVVRLCRKHPVFKTKNTRELADRTSPRAPALMTYEAVAYPQACLPLSPYVLGVWLGDGCSHHATVTQGAEDYAYIRAAIEAEGVQTSDRTTTGTFGLLGAQVVLKQLGVMPEKRIPEVYLFASIAQRKALLQGLIDTDGHVAPKGQVEFCSTNEKMALQVLSLVRSLGVKASLISGDATLNGRFISRKYRVLFYMADAARLPRKAKLCRNGVRTPHRFIDIKPAGCGDTICIQVDAADQQYLVGEGYLLTHNSELASVRFPAWHLGHYPHHEIINVGYNLDLPMVFSRKVRELVRDPLYLAIFPNTNLDPESQSVEKWITKAGGGFMAAGVGGGITGKGAHALIIDDPIKNQVEADSVAVRDNLMDWYQSTAYTRLAPGGGILIIQCMTGETQVLMADGTEKRLDSVRAGDAIATYYDGLLSTSTVANWKLSGRDKVFKITTKSGRILRANGRHPFLIFDDGEIRWMRLRALTTAHRIVTLKGNVGSGQGSLAPQKDAHIPQYAGASAEATMVRRNGLMGTGHHQQQTPSSDAQPTSNTGMASRLMSMVRCALRKTVNALFVSANLLRKPLRSTGKRSCVSTTVMIPVPSEDCSATSATSRWDSFKPNKMHSLWPPTSDFILDQILSITEDGEEEVYDIQVDRTENFIANGAVSHNTMWNDDDLAGRLQTYMNANAEVDQFEIVKYPAISGAWEYRVEATQNILRFPDEQPLEPGMTLLRPKDFCLHEARYPTDALKKIRANLQPRIWSALYQQNPMPDTGMYFKKDYFRCVKRAPPRLGMSIFTAWDFAISEEQHNDWTVGVTVLQDETDTLYVLDVLRFKGDSLAIVEAMLDVTQRFGSDPGTGYLIGAEDGQIWRAILPMLKIRMEERKMWPALEVLRPLTDKMARARPLQGRMQQGKIVFLEDAHWRTQAEQELLRFPAGAHDDVVDAMAWVVHLCLGKSPPQLEAPPPLKSWKDRLLVSRGGGSHMTA